MSLTSKNFYVYTAKGGNMHKKKLTIRQSIIWNTWGSVVYLGVQWLQTIFVARLLGFEEAGLFSLAMSVTNIFYAFANYGMKNFQISDVDWKYSATDYVSSRLATSAIALVSCVVFALSNQYDIEQIICITIYMVFKISEAIFDVLSGFYQKQWRMDYLGKSMMMRAVLMLVIFPSVIWVTRSLLWAIIAMTVVVFGVILLYDMRITLQIESIKFCFTSLRIKPLLLECLPLAVCSILSTSVGSIPRYFLEMYEGNEKLGIYASVAMPTLIVQMASTYIFNPMVTVFSESFNQKAKEQFLKTLRQCIMAIVAIAIVALVGGKIFGRFGLRLLYGDSILMYEYLLIPLIVCTITTACVWLFTGVLTVTRNFKALLLGNGCSVVFCIVLSILLIPIWDMQGATVALLLGNIIGIIVFIYYLIHDIKKI